MIRTLLCNQNLAGYLSPFLKSRYVIFCFSNTCGLSSVKAFKHPHVHTHTQRKQRHLQPRQGRARTWGAERLCRTARPMNMNQTRITLHYETAYIQFALCCNVLACQPPPPSTCAGWLLASNPPCRMAFCARPGGSRCRCKRKSRENATMTRKTIQ